VNAGKNELMSPLMFNKQYANIGDTLVTFGDNEWVFSILMNYLYGGGAADSANFLPAGAVADVADDAADAFACTVSHCTSCG